MPSISELFKNTLVRIALAVIAVILAGSLAYYLIESNPPALAYATVTKGNLTEDVTATGIVSPVQNPSLSFEVGGQVSSVSATVGEKVSAGMLLASLDTSVLAANLEAAQAKLEGLEAGPRGVDVAGQQTSVSTAQQALQNTYTNYPTTLQSTYAKADEALTTEVDPLFGNISYRSAPTLTFDTINGNEKITVDGERLQLTSTFNAWQSELSAATSSPSASTFESTTDSSLAHLQQISQFLNDLVAALNNAQVGPSFSQAQQTADLASVNAARDTINGLITSLTSAEQSISTQQLAVQSSQDQLNDALAGATPQDIQAQQAAVNAIEAQIRQQEIVAPFAGTIASVSVKPGDVASPNTPAITLIPQGNFEVDVYLAENDVTKLKTGDAVDVTLDAYGTGRIFPATVASIDASPSTDPNNSASTGYKVTLVFAQADPSIANGMHANVTIHAGSAQNVLMVPKSAVITDGTQSYVLKQASKGPVQTAVTVGISNDTSVEIDSGLVEGDKVSTVGAQ